MDRDEALVKVVEQECIIWKRNHPLFKSVAAKEQAWARVAFQLGISSESCKQIFNSFCSPFLLKTTNMLTFTQLQQSSFTLPSLPESNHDDFMLIQLFYKCTLIPLRVVLRKMNEEKIMTKH